MLRAVLTQGCWVTKAFVRVWLCGCVCVIVCLCVCIHAEGHRCKPAICSPVFISVNNICSEKMSMFPFGSLTWAWKVPVLSSPVKWSWINLNQIKSSQTRPCQAKPGYFKSNLVNPCHVNSDITTRVVMSSQTEEPQNQPNQVKTRQDK